MTSQSVLTGRHPSCAGDDPRQTEFTTHLREVEAKSPSNVPVSLTSEDIDNSVNVNVGRGIDDTFTVHHHPVCERPWFGIVVGVYLSLFCKCMQLS